eukprot:scaffold423015_cov59-Attheya_sp.AAC.2
MDGEVMTISSPCSFGLSCTIFLVNWTVRVQSRYKEIFTILKHVQTRRRPGSKERIQPRSNFKTISDCAMHFVRTGSLGYSDGLPRGARGSRLSRFPRRCYYCRQPTRYYIAHDRPSLIIVFHRRCVMARPEVMRVIRTQHLTHTQVRGQLSGSVIRY